MTFDSHLSTCVLGYPRAPRRSLKSVQGPLQMFYLVPRRVTTYVRHFIDNKNTKA